MIQSGLLSNFADSGLIHGVSTALDGSLYSKDEEKWSLVISNREKLASGAGLEMGKFVFFEQVHGSQVDLIDSSLVGSGVFYRETEIKNSDGGFTKESNIFLVVKTADCVPIIGFDPKSRSVFAVHAGFRSIAQGIHLKLLYHLASNFGSKSSDLVIFLAPSIKRESYIFEDTFQNQLDLIDWQDHIYKTKDGISVDLPGFLKSEFLKLGVKESNIDVSPINTFVSQRFYSAQRGDEERFISFIGLKN